MERRSEDFYQFLNKRRTLRFFSDKPVSRRVMENIVKAAGTAPSGAHTEPWTYVVVRTWFHLAIDPPIACQGNVNSTM